MVNEPHSSKTFAILQNIAIPAMAFPPHNVKILPTLHMDFFLDW